MAKLSFRIVPFVLALFALTNAQIEYLRFVNGLPQATITIGTNKVELASVQLAPAGISDYVAISQGTLEVTITGVAATLDGVPILIPQENLSGYATVLVSPLNNTSIAVVAFREDMTDSMKANATSNKSYVRVLNAANVQVSASAGATVFSFVGYLAATPFAEVDPTVPNFQLTTTGSDVSQNIPATLEGGNAYTLFTFKSGDVLSAVVKFDRKLVDVNSTEVIVPITTSTVNLNGTGEVTTGADNATSQTATSDANTATSGENTVSGNVATTGASQTSTSGSAATTGTIVFVSSTSGASTANISTSTGSAAATTSRATTGLGQVVTPEDSEAVSLISGSVAGILTAFAFAFLA
eukprot:TRINITY_DN6738_c0_g1_i1.p1 TRINITY_DN6738_c0_g1~~TRINITY_DN6738_c0_g1_i1.p1  ORF type:complete len:354 (-),score=99.10 TRINITY_DN6738_c0_g1_i1:62-1123(-)